MPPPCSAIGYDPDDYERVTDILDVWFDSGCTHVFMLESGHWPEQRWPADLYLEGSDQHRGWFQSSLLESCGTRGRAPYKAVLTHGFTMDAKGMKMSKSLGNTVDPLEVMRDYGADIIRLWALSVDFTEDHRIGKEILDGVADQYRKLRNTFRYLLGALDGFSEEERVDDVAGYAGAGALHAPPRRRARRQAQPGGRRLRLQHLRPRADRLLQRGSVAPSTSISARTASIAMRRPIRKRRAYRTVLDTLFQALVRWLAPVLVFTTEEVWGTRYPDAGSVHLLEWPELPPVDADDAALGRAARAAHPGHRGDRAAAPRQGPRLEPRSRGHRSRRPPTPPSSPNCSSPRPSATGDSLTVAKTSQPQMRPLLAAICPRSRSDGDLCARCAEVVA